MTAVRTGFAQSRPSVRSRKRIFPALFAALLSSATAIAAEAPLESERPPVPAGLAGALGHPSEVSVSDSKRIDFISSINGRSYSVMVSLPSKPAPSEGYPVIYVLDGDEYFSSFVSASRKPTQPDAIIVGIGYPHDERWIDAQIKRSRSARQRDMSASAFDQAINIARFYDLTPSGVKEPSVAASGLSEADAGGGSSFFRVIEEEIKPRIEQLAPTDRERSALFGHSLGGLFVLDTLFTHPRSFKTFIASSPSIYWADYAVLKREAAFRSAVAAGEASPRILIAVGGLEEGLPPRVPASLEAVRAEFEADLKAKGMVVNNCALAARLRDIKGRGGYEVADCFVSQDVWHVLAAWPAMARGFEFINAQP